MVDIGRALGVSHAALYRFYASKSAVMDAIVEEAMAEEEAMAAAYLTAEGSAGERLQAIVFELCSRKIERFVNDRELHDLYRRILVERYDIIENYSQRMTEQLRLVIEQGIDRGEWKINDAAIAASVVRDAVTVYVHPLFVAQAVESGQPIERMLRSTMLTLLTSFKSGVNYRPFSAANEV